MLRPNHLRTTLDLVWRLAGSAILFFLLAGPGPGGCGGDDDDPPPPLCYCPDDEDPPPLAGNPCEEAGLVCLDAFSNLGQCPGGTEPVWDLSCSADPAVIIEAICCAPATDEYECEVDTDCPEGHVCEFPEILPLDTQVRSSDDAAGAPLPPRGQCVPAPADACDADDSGRSYISTDPFECAAILFMCVDDLVPFSDECGCGCTEPDDTVCTADLAPPGAVPTSPYA